MLADVRIVLVDTSHPGNIGAVARAMKTMSLNALYLVRPQHFPSAECTARAAGADDVLAAARICSDLAEALADCRLAIGTSARRRSLAWPQLDARQSAARLLAESAAGPVALVFGRESSGLSNAELDHCQLFAQVPTDAHFSSLNLAAAVQLFAYEIRMTHLTATVPNTASTSTAPLDELEGLFQHGIVALQEMGFADPRQSRKLFRRLRRLFYRARPDRNEINMLRGILTAGQYLARRLRKMESGANTHEHS